MVDGTNYGRPIPGSGLRSAVNDDSLFNIPKYSYGSSDRFNIASSQSKKTEAPGLGNRLSLIKKLSRLITLEGNKLKHIASSSEPVSTSGRKKRLVLTCHIQLCKFNHDFP